LSYFSVGLFMFVECVSNLAVRTGLQIVWLWVGYERNCNWKTRCSDVATFLFWKSQYRGPGTTAPLCPVNR